MDSDENHPRVMAAAEALNRDIQNFIVGRPLTPETLSLLGELIQRARRIARQRDGVELPELVGVVIPRHRRVHLYRRDLDRPAIEARVKLLAKTYPDLTAHELASIVRQAWPRYRPHQVGIVE